MRHSRSGQVIPLAPFDFSKTLDAHWSFNQQHGQLASPFNSLLQPVMLAGTPYAMQIRSVGYIEKPILEYTVFSDQPIADSVESQLVERMAFSLSLHEPLQAFYELASADTHFASTLHRLYGYHPIRYVSAFEAVCWTILSQRSLLILSQRMRQAFLEAMGTAIEIEEGQYWAFPEPEQVLGQSPDDLSDWIGDGKRAEQIYHAAQSFAGLEADWLMTAEYTEAEGWLKRINGVGLSSAHYVMMHGLGRLEQVPLTHKKLLTAVRKLYGGQMSRADIPRLTEQYGPWQGYWAIYVMHMIEP